VAQTLLAHYTFSVLFDSLRSRWRRTLAACATQEDASVPPAQSADAGAPDAPPAVVDAVDHGAPSETYPAFAPALPRLVNNGGRVLSSPVIVTITFPGESHAAELERFGDVLGSSAYWHDIVDEYGVKAATSGAGNHVRMPQHLSSDMSQIAFEQWIVDQVKASPSPWPAPTTDTLFVFYAAQGTSFVDDECAQSPGGYHGSVIVDGQAVSFAVVFECKGDVLDDTTLISSHEIAEAATDADPQGTPAWIGLGPDVAWELLQNFSDENGDMCENEQPDMARLDGQDPFGVQRQWSNKSAALGRDPCVPAAGPYFGATPLDPQEIVEVALSAVGLADRKGKVFRLEPGQTKSFPLGVFSDAPLDAWNDAGARAGGIRARGLRDTETKSNTRPRARSRSWTEW
jgi:hypothetical protein